MPCYAERLGNCKGPLTLEHWISRSVLDLAGAGLLVAGLPRQQRGKSAKIGAGSLASRILCKKHNEELSPIDAAGTTFLSELHASFGELDTMPQFSDKTVAIPGRLLELWLLKVLCGHLTIHNFATAPALIDILFGRESWPAGEGLYMLMPANGNAAWRFQLVRVALMYNAARTRVVGAKFGLGGFALLLAFGKPKSEGDVQAQYRPEAIVLEREGRCHRYAFPWGDNGKHGTMHCTLLRKVQDQDEPSARFLV